MRTLLVLVLCSACGACGPVGGPVEPGAKPKLEPDARLVVVERGPRGSRLVLVDEAGLRQRTLTDPDGEAPVLDLTPAWSPDGASIVFASSRGRDKLDWWSLWLVSPLEPDAPRRLTEGDAIDYGPAWAPDGQSIIFASTRSGRSFNLWRLALAADGTPGEITAVTFDDAHEEVEPALSPDGKHIVFTRRAEGESKLFIMPAAGGEGRELADGASPRFTPDGKRVVFSAPGEGRSDLNLWIVAAKGGEPRVLVDDAIGDESGARFSADGRFVFATSVLRNQSGEAVISTLVVADLKEKTPRWRGLIERMPVSRFGVDVAPLPLAAKVLARAPSYAEALKAALERLERENTPEPEPEAAPEQE